MSIYRTGVVLLLMCFTTILQSQTLIDQLGGIKTSFIITSDTLVFEVFDQILIERGRSHFGGFYDGGFGYAYKALHLEFISRERIQKLKKYGPKDNYFQVELLDKNGNLLARIIPKPHQVNTLSNQSEPRWYTHSVNLEEVPIILLDKTARINLVFYEQRLRYPMD